MRAVRGLIALVAIAGAAGAQPGAEPPPPQLEWLCDLRLVADGEVRPYVDLTDRAFRMARDLIAQGEGRLEGRGLSGATRWSLLGKRAAESPLSRIHLAIWVDLDDGAELLLTATGVAPGSGPALTAASRFLATGSFEVELEPDYEWLNALPTLWEGGFDPETGTLTFRVWAPAGMVRPAASP